MKGKTPADYEAEIGLCRLDERASIRRWVQEGWDAEERLKEYRRG
jgi:hypothetical protein